MDVVPGLEGRDGNWPGTYVGGKGSGRLNDADALGRGVCSSVETGGGTPT